MSSLRSDGPGADRHCHGTDVRTGTGSFRRALGTYREHMAMPRLFAYAFALLVAAFVVGGVALVTQAPSATTYFAVATALGLFPLGLGLLIAQQRPRNVVGPLLVLVGGSAVWVVFSDTYATVVEQKPGLLPVWDWYVAISPGTWMLLYVPAALLMLLLPGRPAAGPRWRWVVYGFVVVRCCSCSPPRRTRRRFRRRSRTCRTSCRVGARADRGRRGRCRAVAGVPRAARRGSRRRDGRAYRRATGRRTPGAGAVVRAGRAVPAATLLLCWASYLFTGAPDLVLVGLAATYIALPLATAIAMLRHDLYDVDRAISAAVDVRPRDRGAARVLHAGLVPGRPRRWAAARRSPRRPRPPSARSPWRRCAAGCSAGSTAGSTRRGRPR